MWHVALDSDNNVYPVLKTENNTLKIPFVDESVYYSIDEENLVITKTVSTADGLQTTPWKKLNGFSKMTCIPDMDRILSQRKGLIGKSFTYNDQPFQIVFLKRENETYSLFSITDKDKNHSELLVKDKGFFIGIGEEWISIPQIE